MENSTRAIAERKPPRLRRIQSAVCLAFAILLIASCSFQDDPAERRARFAKDGREDIHVGFAWPFSVYTADLFREGVEMALDEVNQAGGVRGRKFRAVFRDDRSSSHEGLVVAQDFAGDPRLLYVIGHCDMNVTLPASLIYQVNGILCITPGTTGSRLARRGFDLVFNSYHTDREISGSLADYCYRQQYRHMVLVYQNTSHGVVLAEAFEERAGELGIDVVARLPYDRPDPRVIRDMAASLQYVETPDAIFVVGLMPGAAQVIAGLRQSGVSLPVMASDDLETDLYPQIAGAAAEGTIVPSSFDRNSPRSEVSDFYRRFETLYHKSPDTWAAQGYDAMKLLAFAVHRAGSAVPTQVAATLRQIKDWPGVAGSYTFNADGEAVGKPVVLKQVVNGQFVYLEEVIPGSGVR